MSGQQVGRSDAPVEQATDRVAERYVEEFDPVFLDDLKGPDTGRRRQRNEDDVLIIDRFFDDEREHVTLGGRLDDGRLQLIRDVVAEHLRARKTITVDKMNTPKLRNVSGNAGLADYAGVLE